MGIESIKIKKNNTDFFNDSDNWLRHYENYLGIEDSLYTKQEGHPFVFFNGNQQIIEEPDSGMLTNYFSNVETWLQIYEEYLGQKVYETYEEPGLAKTDEESTSASTLSEIHKGAEIHPSPDESSTSSNPGVSDNLTSANPGDPSTFSESDYTRHDQVKPLSRSPSDISALTDNNQYTSLIGSATSIVEKLLQNRKPATGFSFTDQKDYDHISGDETSSQDSQSVVTPQGARSVDTDGIIVGDHQQPKELQTIVSTEPVSTKSSNTKIISQAVDIVKQLLENNKQTKKLENNTELQNQLITKAFDYAEELLTRYKEEEKEVAEEKDGAEVGVGNGEKDREEVSDEQIVNEALKTIDNKRKITQIMNAANDTIEFQTRDSSYDRNTNTALTLTQEQLAQQVASLNKTRSESMTVYIPSSTYPETKYDDIKTKHISKSETKPQTIDENTTKQILVELSTVTERNTQERKKIAARDQEIIEEAQKRDQYDDARKQLKTASERITATDYSIIRGTEEQIVANIEDKYITEMKTSNKKANIYRLNYLDVNKIIQPIQYNHKTIKENNKKIIQLFQGVFRYLLCFPLDTTKTYETDDYYKNLKIFLKGVVRGDDIQKQCLDLYKFLFVNSAFIDLYETSANNTQNKYQKMNYLIDEYKNDKMINAVSEKIANKNGLIMPYFFAFLYQMGKVANKNFFKTEEEDEQIKLYPYPVIHIGDLIEMYNYYETGTHSQKDQILNTIGKLLHLYYEEMATNEEMGANFWWGNVGDLNTKFKDTVKIANIERKMREINTDRVTTIVKFNHYDLRSEDSTAIPVDWNETYLPFTSTTNSFIKMRVHKHDDTNLTNMFSSTENNFKDYSLGGFTNVYNTRMNKEDDEIKTMMDESGDMLINKIMSGKNVFLFGYGASGAGKTAMLVYNNKTNNPGFCVAMCNKIVNVNENVITSVKMRIVEYWNGKKRFDVDIQLSVIKSNFQQDGKKTIVYVGSELSEYHEEAKENLDKALENLNNNKPEIQEIMRAFITDDNIETAVRKIAPTRNNPQSSRSHVLCYISFHNQNSIQVGGSLIVADLAGVENTFQPNDSDTIIDHIKKMIDKYQGETLEKYVSKEKPDDFTEFIKNKNYVNESDYNIINGESLYNFLRKDITISKGNIVENKTNPITIAKNLDNYLSVRYSESTLTIKVKSEQEGNLILPNPDELVDLDLKFETEKEKKIEIRDEKFNILPYNNYIVKGRNDSNSSKLQYIIPKYIIEENAQPKKSYPITIFDVDNKILESVPTEKKNIGDTVKILQQTDNTIDSIQVLIFYMFITHNKKGVTRDDIRKNFFAHKKKFSDKQLKLGPGDDDYRDVIPLDEPINIKNIPNYKITDVKYFFNSLKDKNIERGYAANLRQINVLDEISILCKYTDKDLKINNDIKDRNPYAFEKVFKIVLKLNTFEYTLEPLFAKPKPIEEIKNIIVKKNKDIINMNGLDKAIQDIQNLLQRISIPNEDTEERRRKKKILKDIKQIDHTNILPVLKWYWRTVGKNFIPQSETIAYDTRNRLVANLVKTSMFEIYQRKQEGEYINEQLKFLRNEMLFGMIQKTDGMLFTAPIIDTECLSSYCGHLPDSNCFMVQAKPLTNNTVSDITNHMCLTLTNEDEKQIISEKQIKEFYKNTQIVIFTVFNISLNRSRKNDENGYYQEQAPFIDIEKLKKDLQQYNSIGTEEEQSSLAESMRKEVEFIKSMFSRNRMKDHVSKTEIITEARRYINNFDTIKDTDPIKKIIEQIDLHNASTPLGTLLFTDNLSKFGKEEICDKNIDNFESDVIKNNVYTFVKERITDRKLNEILNKTRKSKEIQPVKSAILSSPSPRSSFNTSSPNQQSINKVTPVSKQSREKSSKQVNKNKTQKKNTTLNTESTRRKIKGFKENSTIKGAYQGPYYRKPR